jgi:DNA-binding IclR family transcriptional regulator
MSPSTVRAADRTLQILEVLAEGTEMGITEIANQTSLPTSTVDGYVQSLLERGYVTKVGQKYRTTLHLFTHGQRVRQSLPYFDYVEREVTHLHRELDQNVAFVANDRDMGIVLYRRRGSNGAEDGLEPGDELVHPATAFGQVILAMYSEVEVDRVISKHGFESYHEGTVTTRAKLEDQLESFSFEPQEGYISERGFGRMKGMRAVAALVAIDDRPVGAIGVTGTYSELSGEYFEETVPRKLTEAANRIQVNFDAGDNELWG